MKQTFTLAVVLVFFTLCSFGQKKEIMRNNLQSINKAKTLEDVHSSHGIKSKTPGNTHFLHGKKQDRHHVRRNDFLTAKAKTRRTSDLKSAEAVKQRLDSVVVFYNNVIDEKYYFTYDSQGNNTQEIDYYWDSETNTWEIEKYEYTYDASGNITQEFDYEWNLNTNAWVNYSKGDYTYDDKGNITQEREYERNLNTKEWIVVYKTDYTYDANGNQTQYSYLYLGSDNIMYGRKYEYSYDANGNMLQSISYDWDSSANAWVASSIYKYERTYFANGNIAQELYYYWDSNTNTWVVSLKTDYFYNSQGNNTQEVAYSWDGYNTNTWVGYYKIDYTYDANGNMLQSISYNWDSSANAWVYSYNESKEEYTYDTNGNQTSSIRYEFDETTSQFIPTYKYEGSFNLTYTLSDLIFPWDWMYDDYMNMPVEEAYYEWDKVSNSWVDYEKNVFYSTEISVTSVPNTLVSGINIYPNPVSDYVKVSGVTGAATFNLYNLQGKLILSKTLTGDEPVNVSGLSKGAYPYNIITDRKQQAGKIIKK